jgi:two-component system, OmpR family, response regulator VanR
MTKNILIIDDNEDVLNIFKELLSEEGFSVSTANSGLSGLELFKRKNFDLVVIDINMPGMNGFDVTKKINSIITIPIILMSANYLPVEPDNIKTLRVNAIISKTIDDYGFCELVRHCLEGKVYKCKVF